MQLEQRLGDFYQVNLVQALQSSALIFQFRLNPTGPVKCLLCATEPIQR